MPAPGGATRRTLLAQPDDVEESESEANEIRSPGQVDQFAAMDNEIGFSEDDDDDEDDTFIDDDF